MDTMIPMIYVQFLIVMGPAMVIFGRWYWRTHQEDLMRDQAKKMAEQRLLRLPKRMPIPTRAAA